MFYDGAGGAPRIGVIGDSSAAGIRWADAYAPLRQFNFTFDAESCRRTTAASCGGREGYAPENAITTLRRLSGRWGDALVMVTGYNDPGSSFASAVDTIMAEAASQGISKVIWLTMRTADVSYVAPGYISSSYTFRDNNRILLLKSQQYGGRLQIADWAGYSAGRTDWVTTDGVHLKSAGAFAQATFIAQSAAQVLAGANITPPPPTGGPDAWVTVRRGDRGSLVAMVQNALIRRGIALVGGADGVFGQYTEAAVARFQTSVGLAANGVVDMATAQQLGIYNGTVTPPPPPPPPTAPTWSNVAIGARGSTVAAIQRAVMNAGIYLRGGADGVFGSYTKAAVSTYQSRRGLPATGVVDAATAQAMGLFQGGTTPPAGPSWSVVSQGARGTTVAAIQRAVMNAGIYLFGGADSVYGTYTTAAVATYQRQRGLPETGSVDAATAQAMGLYTPPAPATTAAAAATTTTSTAAESTTSTASPTTSTDAATTTDAPTTTTDAPGKSSAISKPIVPCPAMIFSSSKA